MLPRFCIHLSDVAGKKIYFPKFQLLMSRQEGIRESPRAQALLPHGSTGTGAPDQLDPSSSQRARPVPHAVPLFKPSTKQVDHDRNVGGFSGLSS